jgi:formate dehydrogenase subunit gamma
VSASQVIPGSREGRIVRYTLDERIHHWMAGLTYVYCLITGLAFWSPYLYWLAALVGGGATARFWHPWSGVLFTISIVWMFKLWRGDMAITDTDRAWSKAVKYYVENEDEKLPPVGRFNWGQKVFFWLMLCGAILLLLSGFGLWFVESIPAWLRHLSIAVHVIAALATIAGFIIHVYMGTAMVPGGFDAIVTGEVTAAWARHHHRLWYERVTKNK